MIVQNDPDQKSRSEDDVIAWTWRTYLDMPEGSRDPNVILRNPMTKVTRAIKNCKQQSSQHRRWPNAASTSDQPLQRSSYHTIKPIIILYLILYQLREAGPTFNKSAFDNSLPPLLNLEVIATTRSIVFSHY